jgi:hypothetical protein
MKDRAIRTLAFVTLAALAAACNDSTAPDHQPADLDEVITEMTVPSLAATLVPGMPATPSAAAITPSSCSYDAVSQRFNCPNVTVSGVTFYRWFSLLNAGGTPQPQFDAATTDGVHLSSSLAGNFTANGSDVTVAGNEDLTLRGLLSGVHTLAGTTLLNVNGTDAATGYPFILSVSSTIEDLVLPDTPADRWPKSGSVIVHATRAMAGTTTTSQLSATFNGTSRVDVSLTSAGTTLSCTVDLASQHPTCGG